MGESTDWQVENLRVTTFPENMSKVSAEATWEQCVGTSPEETRTQRGGIETWHMAYKNGRLFLIRQPDRIEWRYIANQVENRGLPELPIIGNLDVELASLVELTNKWFNSPAFSSIHRLAFGAVLLNPVDTIQQGYADLQRFLPRFDLDDVGDFIYRVNRRRESTVMSGLFINRLTHWNVFGTQLVDLAIDLTVNEQVTSVSDLHAASRLELDINTVQLRNIQLPSDKLSPLFAELVKLGLELSREGDIR